MTNKSTNPAATETTLIGRLIAESINSEPIGYTTDGFPLYPSVNPTEEPAPVEAPAEEVTLVARLISQRVELDGDMDLAEADRLIRQANDVAFLLEELYDGINKHIGCTLGQFVELPSTEVGFQPQRGERSCQGMRVVGPEWFENEDLAT